VDEVGNGNGNGAMNGNGHRQTNGNGNGAGDGHSKGLSGKGIAIDLGTANTVVWDHEHGCLFNEPTMMALSFDVNFRDQGAGGVEIKQLPPLRLLRHGFGDAMRREDHARTVRRLIELFDEDGPPLLEPLDDRAVVHDLVSDIDRRAVLFDRELDDADRAVDACAKAARRRQQQRSLRLWPLSRRGSRTLPFQRRIGGFGGAHGSIIRGFSSVACLATVRQA